jgi:hypothetical protein
MSTKRIEVPGMGIVEFPADMSDDQIAAAIKRNMAGKPETGYTARNLRDFVLTSPLGAVARGVKDVMDTGTEFAARLGGPKEVARVRAMNKAGKDEFEAASESPVAPPRLLSAVARIGGNVLATAPAVTALGGAVATVLPRLGQAIRTGGMSTGAAPVGAVARAGDMGLRMGGGAIGGGLAAGMVNPDDAGTGAAIGAALPPALMGLGTAGRAVGQAFQPRDVKAARRLQEALGDDAAVAALARPQTLVPGSEPTVAQVLRTPRSSTLERIVSETPGGEVLRDRYAAQSAARIAALEGVAPVSPSGFAVSRADAGTAIQRGAQFERKQAADAIDKMYRAVDPDLKTRIVLPADKMAAAAEKYLGSGAVGENIAPRSFVAEARRLSAPTPAPIDPVMIGSVSQQMQPRGSRWDEVLRMRSSLNEEWLKAKNAGDRQAAAALDAQKRVLDEAIERQLPPGVFNQWKEANASRAAMGQRFDTGPQAAIFETRNGVPVVQGGEVASMFWGNRPGLAEDVVSFRQLIDDNPRLLGDFRSMVTTEGASTQTAGGNLSNKFVKWVEQRLPGLQQAFEPDQVRTLRRLAADIKRGDVANAAGAARGSPTYMNAVNATKLGLLDSNVIDVLANRLPFGGLGLSALRGYGQGRVSEDLAALLVNPQAAADALARLQQSQSGVLGVLGDPFLSQLAVRGAPVLAADR